jgi:hypothetical protein
MLADASEGRVINDEMEATLVFVCGDVGDMSGVGWAVNANGNESGILIIYEL